MVRISTSQIFDQGIRAMQDQQVKLARLQEQIATGRKQLNASDDPSAAARTLDLEQVVSRTTQYQRNITLAEERLQLQETTLTGVTNLLQRARDLAIQANNSTLTAEDRRAIAAELVERRNELLSLANTVDANGEYLFAGYSGHTKPFESESVGEITHVDYRGDQGKRFVQISTSRQVQEGLPGSAIFLEVSAVAGLKTQAPVSNTGTATAAPAFVYDPTTATGENYRIEFIDATSFNVINETQGSTVAAAVPYTPGETIEFDGIRTAITGTPAAADRFSISSTPNQDVFATLGKFIATLEVSPGRDQQSAALGQTIEDIDNALERITEFRTSIGGRLNALDSQRDENDAFVLQTQNTLSRIRDLDYAEAVSQLQLETFTLQAAQAAFARFQGLSLFDFIR